MITLYLLHPVHKTPVQDWSFEQVPVIRIGRSTSNDVILYSAVVSRHHVEIHRTGSGWQLKNIGTNGTYIDGKRISEFTVSDGLVLRLARSGPIIQIQTDQEEDSNPLKQILSQRSALVETAPPQIDTMVDPTSPRPLPNQHDKQDDPSNRPVERLPQPLIRISS